MDWHLGQYVSFAWGEYNPQVAANIAEQLHKLKRTGVTVVRSWRGEGPDRTAIGVLYDCGGQRWKHVRGKQYVSLTLLREEGA